MDQRHVLGQQGEEEAAQFLEKKGYVILEKNYEASFGEIDIIARDRHVLCFIEVKTRQAHEYAPEESVTYSKQKKLTKLAYQYCLDRDIDLDEEEARFDVVAVTARPSGEMAIELIENAFDAC